MTEEPCRSFVAQDERLRQAAESGTRGLRITLSP